MRNIAKRPLHRQAREMLTTVRDFSAIATASPELQLRIVNLLVRAALDEPVRQVEFSGLMALLVLAERRAA
jgi:hypothetical protein